MFGEDQAAIMEYQKNKKAKHDYLDQNIGPDYMQGFNEYIEWKQADNGCKY